MHWYLICSTKLTSVLYEREIFHSSKTIFGVASAAFHSSLMRAFSAAVGSLYFSHLSIVCRLFFLDAPAGRSRLSLELDPTSSFSLETDIDDKTSLSIGSFFYMDHGYNTFEIVE